MITRDSGADGGTLPCCDKLPAQMASALQIATPDATRRIRRVQTITVAWMGVEAAVSLVAAWRARSPALVAFGGDSAIELLSAVVVLWRFRANSAHEYTERRAARIAGVLLFMLAAFVVAAAAMVLLGYSEPKPTPLGIAVLIAAAAMMPWLVKEKRRLRAHRRPQWPATAVSRYPADGCRSCAQFPAGHNPFGLLPNVRDSAGRTLCRYALR